MNIAILTMVMCCYFRAAMTHASVSPEEREELGITDTLVCMYKCNQWHRKLFKGGGGAI